MTRLYRKVHTEESCLDLARERLRLCYDRYDTVRVQFSGGKDSTVCLNLALEIAAEAGRLPVLVDSFDEEAIPPETVQYMDRVAARPDLVFRWFCLPVKHSNACSRTEPVWYPWDPDKQPLWCRPLPPQAITRLAGHDRQPIHESHALIAPPSGGTTCLVMGIRADESISRFQSVACRQGREAFLSRGETNKAPWIIKAYPIYDWVSEDVWLAPHRLGWDYNRAYDVMAAAGIPLHTQRCAPPYGSQPMRRLHTYAQCWPDLWARMVARVDGAATAARYGNTPLYGTGQLPEIDDPTDTAWKDLAHAKLMALEPGLRAEVAKGIHKCLSLHMNLVSDPIPDRIPHPISGLSWREISRIPITGNDKFERVSQKVLNRALGRRKKAGIFP